MKVDTRWVALPRKSGLLRGSRAGHRKRLQSIVSPKQKSHVDPCAELATEAIGDWEEGVRDINMARI